MAIVKIIQGDLIKLFKHGYFEAIGHGANCRNLMGAGIAKQIHEQIPEAYDADTEFYKRLGGKENESCSPMCGEISVAKVEEGRVFNLYTQLNTGRCADYQMLQSACEKLSRYCKQRSITRVGLPLLGSGIGGLDVLAVATIINLCTPDVDVTLVAWSGDESNWKSLQKFRNYGFPNKFDGLALRIGHKEFELYTKDSKTWEKVTFDTKTTSLSWHMGEYAVSFNRVEPSIYLTVDAKEELNTHLHRLY